MKKFLNIYKIEITTLSIIISLSLLNIYKATLLNKSYSSYFNKTIIFIFLSLVMGFIISRLKFKYIYKFRYYLYLINIILLIYPLLFSKSINHVKAWINLGFISFQPSEFTKFTCPLVLIDLIKKKKYIKSLIVFLIPTILILLEPDTGNVVILFLMYMYLLVNKKNKKIIYLLSTIVLSLISITVVLFIFKEKLFISLFNGSLYYRLKRIIDFKHNYQITSALIGIGNAKLFPISLSRIIVYIPEGVTDFIFSFSICNIGIILTIVLLMSYLFFIFNLIYKKSKYKNYFKKKLYGSFLIIFIFQSLYNILMNIGLVPIMGIPLPFFSYGGSNIISYIIMLFLINKKISSIEDKGNNNYKNNYHKVPVGKSCFGMD